MPELPDASVLVAAVVLVALLAAGPGWSASRDMGEGTADVRVVSPDWLASSDGPTVHQLRTEPGAFGTEASYLRTPAVTVDVANVTGSPVLYYALRVPEFEAEPRPVRRLVDGPGRYRLAPEDAAIPPLDYARNADVPPNGTYEGHLLVRVQSFSGDTVVANRTVEVVVDR